MLTIEAVLKELRETKEDLEDISELLGAQRRLSAIRKERIEGLEAYVKTLEGELRMYRRRDSKDAPKSLDDLVMDCWTKL